MWLNVGPYMYIVYDVYGVRVDKTIKYLLTFKKKCCMNNP